MSLCKALRPRTLVDLGSGFSSFVFRYYALNAGEKVTVWSVDDSSEWLERTREFILRHKLNVDNLTTWDDFEDGKKAKFDIVLPDLGVTEVRVMTLKKALSLARPGGIVVLDDIHHPWYRSYAIWVLSSLKLSYYRLSSPSWTRDKFGRYSILVRP